MQGCHLVESHKSAGCGPVRSPETVPAREQENKKANQKQHSKNRKTHNQNQNQTKTTERSGIATSNGNYKHDDILCLILRMAQHKKQNGTNTKHTNGPHRWVRSNKAPCGNQGSPQPGSTRSQRAAVRHDITPRHFEANTDNAGSQREW